MTPDQRSRISLTPKYCYAIRERARLEAEELAMIREAINTCGFFEGGRYNKLEWSAKGALEAGLKLAARWDELGIPSTPSVFCSEGSAADYESSSKAKNFR